MMKKGQLSISLVNVVFAYVADVARVYAKK
jgi:hypothetical protein